MVSCNVLCFYIVILIQQEKTSDLPADSSTQVPAENLLLPAMLFHKEIVRRDQVRDCHWRESQDDYSNGTSEAFLYYLPRYLTDNRRVSGKPH